jgi:pimeloyl-ACP methyl ester carboxylesterase
VGAAGATSAPRIEERRAAELNVALCGDVDAPPLVLLHGLAGSWQLWRAVLPALSARFRVVAVDLPGFGRSPAPPGGVYDLAIVAARLERALDALDVGVHALVGHSMGGGVGVAFAAERPQRVARLALISPAGLVATGAVRPSWRSPAWHRVGREATRLADPALTLSPRLRRLAFARLMDDPATLSGGQARELVRGARRGRSTGPAGIAIVHAGLRDRIHRLTMPVLVVWGERDRVVSPGYARTLAHALPDGRLLLLPATGHLPMVEAPDVLAGALADFASGGA